MKLTLDVPIKVEIVENGEIKEILEVTYRYPTKKEEKEFRGFEEEVKNFFKKLSKLRSKLITIDKKIEYAEKRGDYEKAEKLLDEKEKIEIEAEKIAEEFEKRGGENYEEELNKKIFEILVGGKDKEKLKEYAERVGYSRVVSLLSKERDKIEKKQ